MCRTLAKILKNFFTEAFCASEHPENLLSARTTLSLADDFDQRALAALAVELSVEDLFPRTEVELSLGNGHDHRRPVAVLRKLAIEAIVKASIGSGARIRQ